VLLNIWNGRLEQWIAPNFDRLSQYVSQCVLRTLLICLPLHGKCLT